MEAPRPHRHPRPCGRMRLLRVAVEDEMVEPERIHLVAQRLHRIRVFEPARLRRATGETFGADEGLAVDVRGGRGNLDRIGGSTPAHPEFAHQRVDLRACLLIVERAVALRFGVREERSEEHTSELQSLIRISSAAFCLNKKTLHHPNLRILTTKLRQRTIQTTRTDT